MKKGRRHVTRVLYFSLVAPSGLEPERPSGPKILNGGQPDRTDLIGLDLPRGVKQVSANETTVCTCLHYGGFVDP